MPTAQMVPNYTVGWVPFNNGSRNDTLGVQYLGDNTDATYIANWFNTRATVTFPALSSVLPFGAVVKQIQSYVRGSVTPLLASSQASLGNGAQLVTLTVSLARAEGGVVASNVYNIGSSVSTDIYGAYIAWPAAWTDPANAPQLILDAGAPALVFNDGASEYAQHVSEARIIVTYATQPVVAVLTPTSGGTITDTTKPTISWSYTQGTDGGSQSRFHVAVYTYEQTLAPGFIYFADERAQTAQTAPVWDSGDVIGSGTSIQVGVDLQNNQQYKVFVKAAQDVNGVPQWSDARSTTSPFTISIPPTVVPARPSVVGIPDPANARVKVTATQTTTPAWDSVTIERSNDNGVTWTPVRSADHAPAVGATFIVWDYESGNGELVSYRAKAHLGSVVSAYSPVTPRMYWSSPYAWLKSPTHPELNKLVRFATSPELKTPIKQGVFEIPGRETAIVVSDVRKASRIDSLQFMSTSDDELFGYRALFSLAEPLLLQVPESYGIESGYFSCGDVTYKRPNRVIQSKYRVVQTSAIRVDAPVGEIVGVTLTWADVLSHYATWQNLIDIFPTWADLLGTTAAQLPSTGGGGGSDTDPPIIIPPVDPSAPIITDNLGNEITDESGNIIAATSTSIVVVRPTLLYYTDWSTGQGPWLARTTGNGYPVTNTSKHNYRPQNVTFAPAALGNKGVRIEAVYDAALTAAKADGSSWYYSGLIDCRYTMDFDFSAPLRFTYDWRCVMSRGVWPSTWLMPTPDAQGSENTIFGGWPRGGELDLHEAGQGTQKVTGAIHEDDPFQSGTLWSAGVSKTSVDWSQFHTTRVDWLGPNVGADWYLDGVLMGSVRNLPHPPLPWDNLRYYPIINLAMGGNYVSASPGNPVHGITPDTGNYYDVTYFQVEAL